MIEQRVFEIIVLGGGYFQCLETALQQVQGVQSTMSGHADDHVDRPNHRAAYNGNTGHVEVVAVKLDPAVILYCETLDIFFAVHDPTTADYQGSDAGPQCRSTIFARTPG